MGVRGLTTFIAKRSDQYLEKYELHDCYLVIDGNSIAYQLYKWHCKCNDCFGGDYDKYRNAVTKFFKLLADCNITPLVIFDGAYEKRKMRTVFSRMRGKIEVIKDLNSVTEGRLSLFPLFLRELFVDILLRLGVKCVRCDFEADSDAAYLARCLKCPLLSYDSDFYIFDVLYIPFSTMELHLQKNKNVKYISCQIYRVDKFLNSFGGLDKVQLPLLSALLGNDYIQKQVFSVFYRQLGVSKNKPKEQQIKAVIMWLKHETPDSALRKILGRYKLCNRKQLARAIRQAIKGYQAGDSDICDYFNVEVDNSNTHTISVPDPEDVEDIEDADDDAAISDQENDSSDEDNEEEGADEEEEEPQTKSAFSASFHDNYRKCLFPSCFMDMIAAHTYYCIPQIEDFSREQSHKIGFEILAAIHKILTFPNKQRLICVARTANLVVKKFPLPWCKGHVPKLAQIESLDLPTRRQFFFNVLKIDDVEFLEPFPPPWHLYLVSLKYWVKNCENGVEIPYIYALILCAIVLNFVDTKIGFYRSTKSFLAKYSKSGDVTKSPTSVESITEGLEGIDLNNSVSCMKNLIDYFQMDAKMRTNLRLFDRNVVHAFAQFQSCLLHVKYLNSLLNRPFDNLLVSDFYDGTFLYNMTANLLKRTDLKGYVKILLNGCPKILEVMELMVGVVENDLGDDLAKHEPPRKRRKKRKKSEKQDEDVEEAKVKTDSDEEPIFYKNNIYSMLSFMDQ